MEWTLPNESTVKTQTGVGPYTTSFNKVGTFPIILNTKDNNGCQNTSNQLVTVNGINADFTAPSVCIGNPTTFTCATSGLSGLTWDFGDASTGTISPINHTYATPGDYTAKLTVIGGGCTNVFFQKVSVLGATVTTTPDPAQTCPGNQLTLNATANVTGNASGSKVFNTTSPVVTIPSGDYYSYTGVDDPWDGSVGTGVNSASSTDVGISSIPVTGLNSTNWKINSVSLNINTSRAKYISAFLETPCGSRIKLIARTTTLANGGGFSNITFTPTGTVTIGSSTTTPLTGTNYAANEISKWNTNLLSCTNPNGTWKLIVGEYYNITTSGNASITNWSIDFQSDVPNVIQSIAWTPTTNLSAIAYTGATTASGTATAKTSTAETLTLTVVDKGGCTTKKQVTVSVSAPQPPTCPGITVCTGQSGTLTATGATGATFKWYADNTTTTTITGSGTTGTFTTPNLSTATSYYVSQVSGGCESTRTKVDVNVTNSNSITLTSATGTDAQTVCLNTAITNITYSTTGATGATITGLPTGVTGNWSTNTVTISGTPTTSSGSPFTYTITLTGGCGTVIKTGTITVNPIQTLGVTCGTTTSSSVQFTWTNIPGTTYDYSYIVNSTGTSTTGSLTAGTVNFSKSSLNPGDNVSITVTPVGGTCVSAETFSCTAVNCGTPTVDAINSIIECSNTSVTAINFTSPQGTVTFNWTNNNPSIGIPASGTGNISTFTSGSVTSQQIATISVTASKGGCTGPPTNFTITINPLNTITLSSPSGTDAHTVCNNTAINDITYNTTGATDATFTGLPAGVNGSWVNNVITISGTPTTANNTPYTYTITLTGGCGTITKSGTIKVNSDNTVNLTSAINTDNQTVCVNSAITNITYATTGATGATISGLPSGVTGNWNNNIITISGIPTTNTGSPFSYSIDLTGGCGNISTSGSISVNPINTINLTSATNTDNQSNCLNTPITDITYATTGATGANFTGLPSGVTGNWNNNNITISGTPLTNTGSPFS